MRILIVKLGAIGDVVHTLPALAAMRRAWPEAHLTWVVERGGAAKLLRDNPCLDELIEVDTRGWRKNLLGGETRTAIKTAVAKLRGFDVAVDFQGLLKSGMMMWLSRAPRRIGFAKEALREPASAYLMTERVKVDDHDHIIKKNLQLIAHLGISIEGAYEFPLGISFTEQQFAEQQIDQRGGNVAIINPGGGWPTKLWNAQGFAAIADRLWDNYGWRSVVTYGPGEEALAQSVVAHSRSGAVELLNSTLKQFFALAQRARLFLGGDTGPLHLAAAAGTPIVGIYGPTPARRNGPFAPADVIVERFDLDCRVGCFRRSCSHTSCMNIPVEAVWQQVQKRISATNLYE
ncbi:MAG: glycosyltransferase family 9 protein [Blastocatellia bacterium]|nr:glycosyltransferase family 9 protein [Blastocatellia bacterium]